MDGNDTPNDTLTKEVETKNMDKHNEESSNITMEKTTDILSKDCKTEIIDNNTMDYGQSIGLPLTATLRYRVALQLNIQDLKRLDKTYLKNILPEMQEKCGVTEQEMLLLNEQDQVDDDQCWNELLLNMMLHKLDFEIKAFLTVIKSDQFGVCIVQCIEAVILSLEHDIYQCILNQEEIVDAIAKLDEDVGMAIKFNAKLAVQESKNEISIKLHTMTVPDSNRILVNDLQGCDDKKVNSLSNLLINFCDLPLNTKDNKTYQTNMCDRDTLMKAFASYWDSNQGKASPTKSATCIIDLISEDLATFEKVVFQHKGKVCIKQENEISSIVVQIYDRFYCHALKEDFVSGKLSDRLALWLSKKKMNDLDMNQTLVLVSEHSDWEMVANNMENDIVTNSSTSDSLSFPACYAYCKHSNTWYWSMDRRCWMNVSANTVNGGVYSGLTPSKTDQMVKEYLCSCEELDIQIKDICLPCIQKLYASYDHETVTNEKNVDIENATDNNENTTEIQIQEDISEQENQSHKHRSVQTILYGADIARLQTVPKPCLDLSVKKEDKIDISSKSNSHVDNSSAENSTVDPAAGYFTPPSSPSTDSKKVVFNLPENSSISDNEVSTSSDSLEPSGFRREKSRSFKARKKLPPPPPPPPSPSIPPPPVDLPSSSDSTSAPIPPPPPLPGELASFSIPPVTPPLPPVTTPTNAVGAPPPVPPPVPSLLNTGHLSPPPPPPIPGIGAPAPPPAPPVPAPRGGNNAAPPPPPPGMVPRIPVNLRPLVKTKSPMKPLFWKKMQLHDIKMRRSGGDESKSIWEEIKDIVIDVDELDELFAKPTFARSQSVRRRDPKTRPQAKESTKLLEPKRSQNVGIFMTSLRMSPEQIEKSLMECNTEKLPQETLQQLHDHMKDEEEIKFIKEHKESHPNDVLDKPEQFLYDLSKIPAFANRCYCLIFTFTFQEQIGKITAQLQSIKQAAQTLIEADSVKTVLSVLLVVGNYMNGGTPRGQADGFALEILSKLKDARSTDNSTNLLQFLVGQYVRVKGEFTPLPPAEGIKSAAIVSLDEIDNDFTQIRKELGKCEQKLSITKNSQQDEDLFCKKMNDFITKANKKLEELQKNMEETRTIFHKCTRYFAASSQTTEIKPMDFFEKWADFCADFNELLKKQKSSGKSPIPQQKMNKETPIPKPRQRNKKQPTIPEDEEHTAILQKRDSVKVLADKLKKTGLQFGKNAMPNQEGK